MSRIVVTISKWINIVAHLRENFEAREVQTDRRSGIVIFRPKRWLHRGIPWKRIWAQRDAQLKWRKYDVTHVRGRRCICPTKLHGEYVTLHAHKDRLIARKIPTRALNQRLSVRFKWSPARFALRMKPILFPLPSEKRRKIGKRRIVIPHLSPLFGKFHDQQFHKYYKEDKKYHGDTREFYLRHKPQKTADYIRKCQCRRWSEEIKNIYEFSEIREIYRTKLEMYKEDKY